MTFQEAELFQLTPSRRATKALSEDQIAELFQLTPSRRATDHGITIFAKMQISTHALTEGDGRARDPYDGGHGISTHALTEGDVTAFLIQYHGETISTHALTEGDLASLDHTVIREVFQLTPSRRATVLDNGENILDVFQLTPSRRATPWI